MKSFIATVLTLLVLGEEAKVCESERHQRMVLSTNASPGQFPYMVSLIRDKRHFCGCSIISANYVVTAAHCLTDSFDGRSYFVDTSPLFIRAGSVHLWGGGIIIAAAEHKIFPHYDGFRNDIAVVRLAQSLNFTDHIRPISLAESFPSHLSNVLVAGWGSLYENGPIPDILQYTSMSSVSHNVCKRVFKYAHKSLLCLLNQKDFPNGGCFGDSGGPAAYNGSLVGVVSLVTCGDLSPDIFVNIVYYAMWIRTNTDLKD